MLRKVMSWRDLKTLRPFEFDRNLKIVDLPRSLGRSPLLFPSKFETWDWSTLHLLLMYSRAYNQLPIGKAVGGMVGLMLLHWFLSIHGR